MPAFVGIAMCHTHSNTNTPHSGNNHLSVARKVGTVKFLQSLGSTRVEKAFEPKPIQGKLQKSKCTPEQLVQLQTFRHKAEENMQIQ